MVKPLNDCLYKRVWWNQELFKWNYEIKNKKENNKKYKVKEGVTWKYFFIFINVILFK